jgi:dTMP kinase
MSAAGRFIVLEGIDGSGTTTQARRLAEELTRRGERVCLTCEPSTGPVGVFIRKALRRELVDPDGAPRSPPWSSMALLFAADRLEHVDRVVLPALAAGQTVVSDRYVLSSLAYQSVTSPEGEASLPFIAAINARARRPDLTLVFDVDEAVAAERRALRGGPPELYEVRDIQRRLAALYARAESLVPGDRIAHIADGPPDAVFARILEAVTAAR